MRVIAGKYRSRPLRSLRGMAMRPTSDRLRETLFNVLGAAITGAVFVDVCAGTGAVGIEALSRGAREVFFIEKHRPAAELIRANLRSLDINAGAEILAMDAVRGLERLGARGHVADIVFADPPYSDTAACTAVLGWLGHHELLAAEGLVIVEHDARQALPERAGWLKQTRRLRQGDAALSFYRRED